MKTVTFNIRTHEGRERALWRLYEHRLAEFSRRRLLKQPFQTPLPRPPGDMRGRFAIVETRSLSDPFAHAPSLLDKPVVRNFLGLENLARIERDYK